MQRLVEMTDGVARGDGKASERKISAEKVINSKTVYAVSDLAISGMCALLHLPRVCPYGR